MRLIDTEIIDDYLGDLADEWYESEEGHGDDFMDGYCWTLNRLQDEKRFPTVDAIPIEYIKNQIGRWERSKCESYHAICYRHLIEEWEMENERKEE